MIEEIEDFFSEAADAGAGHDFVFRGQTLRAIAPDGLEYVGEPRSGRTRYRVQGSVHILKAKLPRPPRSGETGDLDGEKVRVGDAGVTDEGVTWLVQLEGV